MAIPADWRTLIIGGTRGTGAEVARILLEHGAHVRLLVRDPARAGDALPAWAEVIEGDVTKPETIIPAVVGVHEVIYTAGIRNFFAEARARAVVVDGVRHVLDAAHAYGNVDRFVLMSSIGVSRPSAFGFLLNLVKGDALRQKAKAEELVRGSKISYSIMRAGVLTNSGTEKRPVILSQSELPLQPNLFIGRKDAARTLVRCLSEPHACNATFDAVWGRPGEPDLQFDRLVSDPAR